MFTGIVQAVGEVVRAGRRLEVRGELPYAISIGGSVAVNGCCLTHVGGAGLMFDLSEETLERTTLGRLTEGSRVNLEAAVRAGEPLGGHFVQGHVDAVGELVSRDDEEFRFRVPDGGGRYLVDKGSICLNGLSLTVVMPEGCEFGVAVIPHTMQVTNFSELARGDLVNVEYDVLAKYVERLTK